MPVSGFLSSIADKAHSAINASPLAGHIPGYQRPNSPDPAPQPSANEAAQGASKSHTLESLQHQFRSLQQQYSTTTPVQRIITAGKGVAIDFDSVSRDSKAQSKELYTWGQSEPEDLKDVTDRIAYLNFVQGSLANSLATKLDGARAPLKALRDLETSVTPRRNIRAGMHLQINRIEHEQQKGNEKRLADLRDQLKKAEADDQQAEREVEIMKRKAIRESEQLKWDALREYGEKLVLLSQAATPIIAVLPAIPPTPTVPYTGAKSTGAIRASLQRALDNYKTGHINLPSQVSESDLSRSDTRSFGESHASELSSIDSEASLSAAHATPLSSAKPLPSSDTLQPQGIHPIDVTTLNNSPAPIPTPVPAVETVPDPANPDQTLPAIMPTIAETGIPVTSDPSSLGPSSGSLLDIRGQGSAPPATPAVGDQKYESAEEEKKRLAAAYSQEALAPAVQGPSQATVTASTPQSESAEEEKKRLEREERERILHQASSKGNDEDLPPYEDPSLR
ncbi:hypothetical protein BYT27DRAFT_7100068 [Phlegmacium glaucopus]|nr:hypothetical protein BYT27DRAFT_7100068 [Phlegmacium glaucopus]